MSVNRFEITLPMMCATPDALPSKSGTGGASTTILDIRRDWMTKSAADQARRIIKHRQSAEGSTLLRVGTPDDEAGQTAIEQLATLRPHGFVLSGCGGVADIQKFDVMLRVAEATHGLEAGSVGLVAEIGENLAFLLSQMSLKDVSYRLNAIIFDSEGLTQATASQTFNVAASRAGAPLLLARAAVVIKARQAGIACYDLLHESDVNPRTTRDIALADGFSGVIARNAAQLEALSAP